MKRVVLTRSIASVACAYLCLRAAHGQVISSNPGLLQAGTNQTLTLNPDPMLGLANSGTIQALDGGYINLLGDPTNLPFIDNTGGLIEATGTGTSQLFGGLGPSTLELSSVNLSNGTLNATGGGLLAFDDGTTVQNAAITLSGPNSVVQVGSPAPLGFAGTNVSFNQVSFTGDGSAGAGLWVYSDGSGPTVFDNVSFKGLPVNFVGAWAVFKDTITNMGTINFDDPNNPSNLPTNLYINGAVTLQGGGTLNLLNNGNGSLFNGGSPGHFIAGDPNAAAGVVDQLINLDNTITGTGTIGGSPDEPFGGAALQITNKALIEAGQNDILTISADPNLGVINSGTLLAHDGGYLFVAPIYFAGLPSLDNTGGLIEASGTGNSQAFGDLGPSTVELSSVNLSNGTLSAVNGGVLAFDTGATVQNAAITLSGPNSVVQVGTPAPFGPPFTTAIGTNVSFSQVSFTGDGSAGAGLWVYSDGSGPTVFDNVGFKGGLTVNLVGAWAVFKDTITNMGTINFDDPNNPSELPSNLYINGAVTLQGGGTLNLLNNGSGANGGLGHVIDGDPTAADISQNKLVNANNTISGTGTIGGTPDGLGAYTSHLQFTNRGTVLTNPGDSLTLVSFPLAGGGGVPITNEGLLSISAGSLMNVSGDFLETSSGALKLQLGGTTAAGMSSLGLPDNYSHLDVSGTATLDGTLQISLTNGFVPALGQTFAVLDYNAENGAFANYIGLRISSNLVLQPSFMGHSLVLTASTVSSGTTAPLQPVAPGSSASVAPGNTYAGLTSTSPLNTGNDTTVTVLDGQASQATNVSVNFSPAGNFSTSLGGSLVSDIVSFHGTGSDTFVLQLDYNEDALELGLTQPYPFLAWFNGTTWVNAVDGDSDGGAQQQQIIGPYNPATDLVLGDYGVDPVDGRVWAVIDHNSSFAASEPAAAPEPTALANLAAAGGLLLGFRRHRRS